MKPTRKDLLERELGDSNRLAASQTVKCCVYASRIEELERDRARLIDALRDAWKGDLSIERYAQIGALLRELGEGD